MTTTTRPATVTVSIARITIVEESVEIPTTCPLCAYDFIGDSIDEAALIDTTYHGQLEEGGVSDPYDSENGDHFAITGYFCPGCSEQIA